MKKFCPGIYNFITYTFILATSQEITLCFFYYSALEGVCHQLGTTYAFDIGSPTYFRKSIAADGGIGKNNVFGQQS